MTGPQTNSCDVVIIGAGAAGMMCAIEAGRRGRKVVLLEKAKLPGRKIRISGGGRCNFTNLNARPEHYLSSNPRFCISALSRYSPQDFLVWVQSKGIAFHEKTLGQLFCDGSAQQIVDMLVDGCAEVGVKIICDAEVTAARKLDEGFEIACGTQLWQSEALVVACGGPSIPKMGATRFGYGLANHFGLALIEPKAGLVPLVFKGALLKGMTALSGLSLPVSIRCEKTEFSDDLLFTHRGLSGPVILQISNYWSPGDEVIINLLPDDDVAQWLLNAKQQQGKSLLKTLLSQKMAKSLVSEIQNLWWPELATAPLSDFSDKKLVFIAQQISHWRIKPSATEGYRTAEVTLGGVDTDGISSKTMEAKQQPGLFFIGEVLDVTGHLGGYNFQWAWSSGYSAGLVV